MFPPFTAAASLVPSSEEAILSQNLLLATGFQLSPASAEIQMFPP
jgi:hypothetical protein